MTRVLATGTFDLLHPGHMLYLEEAKKLGDELVVIVARRDNVKHKTKPVIPDEQRLKMVASLRPVDKAILGSKNDIFEPLYDVKPDIIALGPNQHFDIDELTKELKSRNISAKVVRITAFEKGEFSSSAKIIEHIRHK